MTSEISKEVTSEFNALYKRANKERPAKKDIDALRAMLVKYPKIWEQVGTLSEGNIARLLSDSKMTEASRVLVLANLNSMHVNLGYEDSPMLEKMLIDSLLLAWLRLNLYEYQMSVLEKHGMTLDKASFWEKRLSASQSRYLRACRTLAQVRRLAWNIPALQVNINTDAGQQVNVLGDLNRAPDKD